jgi:LysM repeat protein
VKPQFCGRAPIARTRQLTSPAVIGGKRMPKNVQLRHARTRRALRSGAVTVGAAAVGLGAMVGVGTSSASAAGGGHDWSGVAQCESGGNWSINTGNGFHGGLQFTNSTWAAYGGTAYAASAEKASPAQQIAVAEKVLAGQGIGAWPVCGKRLTGGTTSVAVTPKAAPAAKAAPAPKPAPKAVPVPQAAPAAKPAPRPAPAASRSTRQAPVTQGTGNYTVQSGDTLSKIATAHNVAGGWQALYAQNRASVANPNLIFAGQHITL